MKNKKLQMISVNDPLELADAMGLSVTEAAEWEFRSLLNDKIIQLAEEVGVTHEEIAKKAGTARSRITALLNRSRTDFSTDFMIRVLSALGYKVNIKVSKIA